MQFGVGVPTGTEGMMYPVPYAGPDEAIRLAVECERMGFDSVWGNDHVNTQTYVRNDFPDPPRFYDPYIYMAWVAAQTTTLKVGTAISVMSFRHVMSVAKMAATLDQLSHGRFLLGVGIGAYREETESMYPDANLHRGRQAEEFLQALPLLFNERRASFDGEFVKFHDVESYPKPAQQPLPVLSGGNATGSKERAAKYCQGWLPALLTPAELKAGVEEIHRYAEAAGRELPDNFDVAPQYTVCLGSTYEKAWEALEASQLHTHMKSLSKSTMKGRDNAFEERHLVGTAQQVRERVHAFAEAGATTMCGLYFAANTVEATLDMLADFAENVIAPYRRTTA